jgi:hypothetical protein
MNMTKKLLTGAIGVGLLAGSFSALALTVKDKGQIANVMTASLSLHKDKQYAAGVAGNTDTTTSTIQDEFGRQIATTSIAVDDSALTVVTTVTITDSGLALSLDSYTLTGAYIANGMPDINTNPSCAATFDASNLNSHSSFIGIADAGTLDSVQAFMAYNYGCTAA